MAFNPTNGNDTANLSGPGTATVDFLAGIDTLNMGTVSRFEYTIVRSADGKVKVDSISGASGGGLHLTVDNLERMHFPDGRLALDINGQSSGSGNTFGTGNAGLTAKILGAVFGPASIAARPDYVGIGIKLLDDGMAYEPLVQLALDARLGANASHAQVVELLYTNVVGVAPSTADLAYYVGLLDNRTYTTATLGVLACDIDLNLQRIDLMGLLQTGIEYIPVL